MSPEQEDFRPDEEHEDYAARSIFAAGWFRAVLVLTVLAIVVVVGLPYLLNWFEPVPPSVKVPARPTQGTGAPSAFTPAQPPRPSQSGPASAPPQPAPAKPVPGESGARATPALPQVAKGPDTARGPERVPAAAAKPSVPQTEAQASYWVQLGRFKDQKNAEGLARKLREQGFRIQVASVTRSETRAVSGSPGGTYHLVRAGAFADRRRAIAARDELQAKGYAGFLTQGPAK